MTVPMCIQSIFSRDNLLTEVRSRKLYTMNFVRIIYFNKDITDSRKNSRNEIESRLSDFIITMFYNSLRPTVLITELFTHT